MDYADGRLLYLVLLAAILIFFARRGGLGLRGALGPLMIWAGLIAVVALAYLLVTG
jgi:hypothetical protein